MNTNYIFKTVVLLFLAVRLPAGEVNPPRALAEEIIAESGIKGGLVVHAGCGDGSLTAELGESGPWVVHGLEKDRKLVSAARRHVQALGRYGRVSVEPWAGKRLPYADNLVNLLVAGESTELDPAEVMRVLVPQGVLLVKAAGKWKRTV